MEQPRTGIPDTGDLISTIETDPTPDEITDHLHPDWVQPHADATPVTLPEITLNEEPA